MPNKQAISINSNMPFAVISSGQHSNLKEGAERVIKTEAELQEMLNIINEYRSPEIFFPKIDFTKSMLFFYAEKERSYGGLEIEINNVEKKENEILVFPKIKAFDPLQPVLTVLTTPYVVISIKKSELPVRFISKK